MPNKSHVLKYQILASLVFIIHLALVLVILFGWYFPSIKYIYLASLILTLASEAALGYCILTKWEFELRKKTEPDLDYRHSFVSYYAYKYLKVDLPENFIKYSAIIFLAISLIIFYVRTYI